jgi:hypothetical protein
MFSATDFLVTVVVCLMTGLVIVSLHQESQIDSVSVRAQAHSGLLLRLPLSELRSRCGNCIFGFQQFSVGLTTGKEH